MQFFANVLTQGFDQIAQLGTHEVAGGNFLDGQAQARNFAGQILGVSQIALGALTILLGLDTVAVILAVLRKKNQRSGIRRLG